MSMVHDTEIFYRNATNEDRDAIVAIVHAVLTEYGLTPEPSTTDSDIEDVERSYFARGGVFEVLTDGSGRILGTAALRPYSDGMAELRKMYFLPELRGRGFGRAALLRMIAKARARGFRQIYLDTASSMKEAISLYESVGFKPTDDIHTSRCDRAYILDLEDGKK